MTETFVCEPWRREELEAFYLTKMRPLAQSEEVEEFGNIVAPGEDRYLVFGGQGAPLAEGGKPTVCCDRGSLHGSWLLLPRSPSG